LQGSPAVGAGGVLPNGTLPNNRSRRRAVQLRFIALIKPPFKSSEDYRDVGWGKSRRKAQHRQVRK
jgi:hypothetical protein